MKRRQNALRKTGFSAGSALLIAGLSIAAPGVASAGGMMSGDARNMLSVSGGIAMPSFATSVLQNAAGITNIPMTNILLQGGGNSTFSTSTFRGGLGYGNGTFGLAAGADYTNPGGAIGAFYGLGLGFQGIHTLLGFSGRTAVSPSGGSSFNAGMLIYPSSSFNLGFTAMDLTGGSIELGAGLGIHFGSSVSLVVDSAFSQSFAFLGIQPGLRIGGPGAALTVSYGSGTGSSQLSNNEVAIGAALKLGSKINWELYYNRFATYYTAFSIRL
jgi:hypothetical protein